MLPCFGHPTYHHLKHRRHRMWRNVKCFALISIVGCFKVGTPTVKTTPPSACYWCPPRGFVRTDFNGTSKSKLASLWLNVWYHWYDFTAKVTPCSPYADWISITSSFSNLTSGIKKANGATLLPLLPFSEVRSHLKKKILLCCQVFPSPTAGA